MVITVTERETLDLPDACAALGIGNTLGRRKVRQGKLPVIRIGTRILVARATVEAILRGEIDLSDSDDDNRAAQSR